MGVKKPTEVKGYNRGVLGIGLTGLFGASLRLTPALVVRESSSYEDLTTSQGVEK